MNTENEKTKRFGFTQFRFVVAGILLLAAGLKAYQLATAPLPPVVQGSVFTPLLELLNDRYFLMLVVVGEILFALVLIAGFWQQWTWLLSLLGFSVFTLVSMMKGLSGESSCGCFGSITVNPWITLGLDLVIVACLLVFRERLDWSFPPLDHKKVSAVLLSWLILALPTMYWMLAFKTVSLSENHREIIGQSVTLEPMNWLGKTFPLNGLLDAEVLPHDWGQGEWIVLLHHRGCSMCEELLRELAEKVDSLHLDRLAIVEVPDGKAADVPVRVRERAGLVCSLPRSAKWFTPSPVVLTVENGTVRNVQIGISASEILRVEVRN